MSQAGEDRGANRRNALAFLIGASSVLTLAIATVCVAAASLIPM